MLRCRWDVQGEPGLREDICVGNTNLFGSYRTWTIFEAITLDEITKGENLDRKEKKLEEKHSGVSNGKRLGI